MAFTAHFHQVITGKSTETAGQSRFTKFLTRMQLVCEQRAVYRLETEFDHLLTKEQITAMKAELARRKAALR